MMVPSRADRCLSFLDSFFSDLPPVDNDAFLVEGNDRMAGFVLSVQSSILGAHLFPNLPSFWYFPLPPVWVDFVRGSQASTRGEEKIRNHRRFRSDFKPLACFPGSFFYFVDPFRSKVVAGAVGGVSSPRR